LVSHCTTHQDPPDSKDQQQQEVLLLFAGRKDSEVQRPDIDEGDCEREEKFKLTIVDYRLDLDEFEKQDNCI
jgi:hypothetical protein